MLYTERMEKKYIALPKTSQECENMLCEFADEHQRRGMSNTTQRKGNGEGLFDLNQEMTARRERKNTKSRKTLDDVEERSDRRTFRSSHHKIPSETSGGKTRIYSGPETPAISDCEKSKRYSPFEEEIITTNAIQEF